MTPVGPGTATSGRKAAERQLHVCPRCASGLVHATDWEPAGEERWCVELRCPECEWSAKEIHGQRAMDAFDNVLDEGTEALLGDLTELSRAIMEEEVDRFVDALQRGHLIPEDF